MKLELRLETALEIVSDLDNAAVCSENGDALVTFFSDLTDDADKELFVNSRCASRFLQPLNPPARRRVLAAFAVRDPASLGTRRDNVIARPFASALIFETNPWIDPRSAVVNDIASCEEIVQPLRRGS
jgi:hypothetical protein